MAKTPWVNASHPETAISGLALILMPPPPHAPAAFDRACMAPAEGFEPPTPALGRRRSIHELRGRRSAILLHDPGHAPADPLRSARAAASAPRRASCSTPCSDPTDGTPSTSRPMTTSSCATRTASRAGRRRPGACRARRHPPRPRRRLRGPMIPSVLRRRRYSLLWLMAILLLACAPRLARERAAPSGSARRPTRDPRRQTAPGLHAPDLEGHEGRGDADGRITWVNFSTTSSEPCRTEMPAIQRIAEEYADELLILGRTRARRTPPSPTSSIAPGDVADPARPGLDIYYDWARAVACRATTSSASRHNPPRGHRPVGSRSQWSRSSRSCSKRIGSVRKRGAQQRAPSSVLQEAQPLTTIVPFIRVDAHWK